MKKNDKNFAKNQIWMTRMNFGNNDEVFHVLQVKPKLMHFGHISGFTSSNWHIANFFQPIRHDNKYFNTYKWYIIPRENVPFVDYWNYDVL